MTEHPRRRSEYKYGQSVGVKERTRMTTIESHTPTAPPNEIDRVFALQRNAMGFRHLSVSARF